MCHMKDLFPAIGELGGISNPKIYQVTHTPLTFNLAHLILSNTDEGEDRQWKEREKLLERRVKEEEREGGGRRRWEVG